MLNSILSGLGLVGGGLLVNEAYDNLGGIGDYANPYDSSGNLRANSPVADIAQRGADMANFRGYSVTGPTGGGNIDAQGNVNVNLNPMGNQIQNSSQQASQMLQGRAMGDTAQREADVYERIRATQRPEEERAALELENRLFAQGRGGVSTAAYGGTPEQLALAKANAEARNSASLGAIQQSQAEQLQNANLSSQFLRDSYTPQAAAMNLMGLGNQTQAIASTDRRQAAGLFSDALMGGIETDLAARMGQANLMGNLGSGLLTGALTPSQYNPLFN